MALVAGSGLAAITERVEGSRRPWSPAGIRHAPEAPGHRMEVVEGFLGGCRVLAFAGRLHYYQGYSMAEVALPVREAKRWGAEVLVLTNAAGSLSSELKAGALVLIRDHISLLPDSPLRGEAAFVDLTDAYDPKLRALAREVATSIGIGVAEGVYAALPGPSFETPAEARMLRGFGADLVGMSTVPEVIAARRLGMRVLAISVVTNAAGAPGVSVEEVVAVAGEAAGWVGDLLAGLALRLSSAR
ncbi:MAG: purine-nucleoside phosphorylase [Candidatus Methylomirabilales bacterium]